MIEKRPTEHPDDELLVDFVLGHASPPQVEQVHQRLSQDAEFAQRSEKVATLLKKLDCLEAPDLPEALVARTLSAVASAKRTSALIDREAAMQRNLSFPTFSLKELGAIAALIFVVGAILVPSFHHAQQLSSEQACLSQVGQIGTGLLHYANDYNGFLPALSAREASWLNNSQSPQSVSNSRNLWQLVRGKYASYVWFQCPAGRQQSYTASAGMTDFPSQDVIGYSYQDSVNGPALNVNTSADVAAQMAILADSTPVFPNGQFSPDRLSAENSPNHDGRGQAVLYLDKHADWNTCAECGVKGDNIWLVQGVSDYRGTEAPASQTDSFLVPNFGPGGN